MDFFLWGYLKAKIYQNVTQHLQDLGQRVTIEAIALCRGDFVMPGFDAMLARAQDVWHSRERRLKDTIYLT